MVAEKNWDPAPQEREWYRESTTGELGYLVRRDGIDKVRMNRPDEEIIRPFRIGEWVPENERRPMTISQVAEICFIADRRLITYTESPGLAKTWHDLSDEVKIQWMETGPKKGAMRIALYGAIKTAMGPFYR
jgi:hypothetical protein